MAENSVYLFSPTVQFMNVSGKPLVDGYVNVFISGTRSKYYAQADFEGTLHPFNIPLNALGSAVILVSPAHSYDVYVYNSLGTLQMSRYNITPATGEATVITDVTTITSQDQTVKITANSSTEYDLSVANALQSTADSVLGSAKDYTDTQIASGLSTKKDKQSALEFSGSATKTVKKITQNADGVMSVEFEDIDLPQEAPNVNVISTDNSISVSSSIDPDTNTKTFDLSIADEGEVEYGRFIASDVTATATLTKTRGNIELSDNKIQLKKGTLYHFTIRGSYVVTTLSNTLSQVNFIEYSTFNGIPVNVDNSISDRQFFEISYDVRPNSDMAYIVSFSSILNAKVSTLEVDVHSVAASVSGVLNYNSGDAIDLTNDTISVKYSRGLELNGSNELQAKVGNGLVYANDGGIEVASEKGLYFTSDGKLTTVEPDSNFIDITDEWEFDNGFRLQYVGNFPGNANDMRILYSPVSDIVKFTSDCRINRTTAMTTGGGWYVFLRYTGNRFYTRHNAPNVNLAPVIGMIPPIGGITFSVGTDSLGTSNNSLLKLAPVGSPIDTISNTGLAISIFVNDSNTDTYGTILKDMVLKVHKIL